MAFPKEGKGDREAVDEDVGSRSTGKRFGARLRVGVRYSFVDRGSRAIPHLAPRAKSPLWVGG